MQFLDLPTTLEDMTISLGLTGVTMLTKSRFKARHAGSKEIVQIPRAGFILKKDIPKQPTPKKRFRKKVTSPGQPKKSIVSELSKINQYRIDKKQVSHRIRNYVNQMKGEKMLYFWTVTFPPGTTDDIAFILLNKWLTRLRQQKMLKDYIWITERQESGTIHFHMVINQKMNVHTANKFMRASIMYCINDGEINYSRDKAKNYNGVDIAKDRKTRRVINFAKQNKQRALTNYLTKYVTKNNDSFTHLAWHSSRGYSNLIIQVRFTYKEFYNSNCMNLLDEKTMLTCEYFNFYRWKGRPPDDLLRYLGKLNSDILSNLFKQS